MPQKWCKYWLPFQWILFIMKRCYYVDLDNKKLHFKKKETKRTHMDFEASLFQDKHAYLHVVKEVYFVI